MTSGDGCMCMLSITKKILRSENVPTWVVGLEPSVQGLQLPLLPAGVGQQPGLVLRVQSFHYWHSLPQQAEPFGEICIYLDSISKLLAPLWRVPQGLSPDLLMKSY